MLSMIDQPTVRKSKYATRFGRDIGDGSYRRAYKTKRGKWVYKVDKNPKSNYGNEAEYRNYLELKGRQLPEGVKLPEMVLLSNGVLASEYVDGYHPDNWCSPGYHRHSECPENTGYGICWASKFDKKEGFPVKDLHPENVIVTNEGDVYIIDIGHGLRKPGDW